LNKSPQTLFALNFPVQCVSFTPFFTLLYSLPINLTKFPINISSLLCPSKLKARMNTKL
jgi:hypothetical protein